MQNFLSQIVNCVQLSTFLQRQRYDIIEQLGG